MILKLGVPLGETEGPRRADGYRWHYWDKVEEVTVTEAEMMAEKDSNLAPAVHEFLGDKLEKVPTCCTRLCFREELKELDLQRIKLIKLKIKNALDAEIIASSFGNKVFLLNDEGKTIEKI